MDIQNIRIGKRDLEDVIALLGATALVTITVIPLTGMLVRAWNAEGIGFTIVNTIISTTPLSLESIVVFPLGIVLGLVCVFALDRTKYIQALLLVVAVWPLLGTVWYFGFWFDGRIDWLANIPYGLFGVLFGVSVGAADKILAAITDFDSLGIERREFPVAAWGLFIISISITIIGLLDALVFGVALGVISLLDIIVSGVFIGVVAFFIQYRDRHDVGLVSPDRSAETIVVCGLFNYLSARYRVVVSEGNSELNLLSQSLSEGSSVPTSTTQIVFDIHTGGWFDNWVSIATAGYEQRQLLDSQLERVASSENKHDSLKTSISKKLRQKFIPETPVDFVERLSTFDSVILVVPLDHHKVRRAFDPDVDNRELDVVDFVEKYRRFVDATKNKDVNVVMVATSGSLATDYFSARYGDTQIGADPLRTETQNRLKLLCEDIDEDDTFPITPLVVERNSESEVGPSLIGVDALWNALISSSS